MRKIKDLGFNIPDSQSGITLLLSIMIMSALTVIGITVAGLGIN